MSAPIHTQFTPTYRWYVLFVLTLRYISIRYALPISLIFCAVGAISFARASQPYAQAVEGAQAR